MDFIYVGIYIGVLQILFRVQEIILSAILYTILNQRQKSQSLGPLTQQQHKIKMTLTFIFFILISQIAASEFYNLHTIPQNGGAACLDGSPPAYYLHEGLGENKNNYLIYFQGGGYCGEPTLQDTLQSCYQRSMGKLGSTRNIPQTKNTTGLGLLSTLQSQNPIFFDWTKMIVIYCDGSEYAGYRENPIQYKDRNLYFRGGRNVKEFVKQWDNKYKIFDGGSVVITGVSAGGIASFQWGNYFLESTRKAKIYSMPDSGFFITDYYSPIVGKKRLREQVTPLFTLVYNETDMPEPILQCARQPGFDVVDCFNAANYAKYLKTSIFMIQSPYDAWSLKYILGALCEGNKDAPFTLSDCDENVRKVIEDYHANAIQQLGYIKNGRKDVGIWGPACVQHGFQDHPSYNSENFKVNDSTLMNAIERFLENPYEAEWLLDERIWPGNQGCSGLSQISNLQFEHDLVQE